MKDLLAFLQSYIRPLPMPNPSQNMSYLIYKQSFLLMPSSQRLQARSHAIMHKTNTLPHRRIYNISAQRFWGSGRRVRRKSLVISKLSQLLAMLGATFKRLGTMPLYMPLMPSWVTITRTASKMPLYWYPMPDMVLIWKRRRRTSLAPVSQWVVISWREDLQGICTCLSYSSWDSTCSKFTDCTWVLVTFWREVLPNKLICHEVETDLEIVSKSSYV